MDSLIFVDISATRNQARQAFPKDIHKFLKSLSMAAYRHNFTAMPEMKWATLNDLTSYYLHNQFLMLKRKLKGYFVYTIWQNNELKCNTYNEYQFLQLAKKILNGDPRPI